MNDDKPRNGLTKVVLGILGGNITLLALVLVPMAKSVAEVKRDLAAHEIAADARLVAHTSKLDHPVAMGERVKKLSDDFTHHETSTGHPLLAERVKALEANGVALKYQYILIQLLWEDVFVTELPSVPGNNH